MKEIKNSDNKFCKHLICIDSCDIMSSYYIFIKKKKLNKKTH